MIGILPDHEIERLVAERGIIEPFVPAKMRGRGPSYGLSSAGYDLRLGRDFKVPGNGTINPMLPGGGIDWVEDLDCSWFEIGPGGMVLGTTLERVSMPDDLFGMIFGKSTLARCGIDLNTTPIEPGWCGHVTLEISNQTDNPIHLTAGMGIAQLVLSRMASPPRQGYGDGIYQDQGAVPVASRVA